MSVEKTILVTGCSSGFGRLTVETLAAAGHTVYATMRDTEGQNAEVVAQCREWARGGSHRVEVLELDVTSDASVARAASIVKEKSGALDALVNNAGIMVNGLNEAFSVADVQRVFDVNFYGVLRVTNAFLPPMRERGDGLIVTVSSAMGRTVTPFAGTYAASKWAVEALAESYRYELALLGVDSVIVQPGAYPTETASHMAPPSNPDIIAEYGPVGDRLATFGEFFGRKLSGDNAPDPQEVADAIHDIIAMPPGTRPLRMTVGTMTSDPPTIINEVSASYQREVLREIGISDMESVGSE